MDIEFNPPDSHVFVEYSDPVTAQRRESGVWTPPGKVTNKTVEAKVCKVGAGIDGIAPGDTAWFERANAHPVGEGLFSVSIDDILTMRA